MCLVVRVSVFCIALALSGTTLAAQTGVQTSAQATAQTDSPPSAVPPNPTALVSPPPTLAQHAMVVSIHHNASDAGVEVLKAGGNAVDAAVAVGFALAVVFPQAGNLGGGGFMLVRTHTGDAHFLDYRERAPAAASADMYLDAHGNLVPGPPPWATRPSAFPARSPVSLRAATLRQALARAGMAPAIRLAREGFILSGEEARMLTAAKPRRVSRSRRIFQRNGNFFKPGERFTQPELARTLHLIAEVLRLLQRRPGRRVAAFESIKGGGLITAADLATYQVSDRAPLTGSYHGYQHPHRAAALFRRHRTPGTLNILSGYDLRQALGNRSPPQVHLIAEAFRRAYKDRADYLGDPDFIQMPIAQLASPAYAAAWRKSIDPIAPTPSRLPHPPRRLSASTAHRAAAPRARVHRDHPLLRRRRRGQRRLQHLHPQQRLRLRRHRGRARLPAQQRDGRLHLRSRARPTCTASSRARPTPSPPASAPSPT